jgi:hypothetical protein
MSSPSARAISSGVRWRINTGLPRHLTVTVCVCVCGGEGGGSGAPTKNSGQHGMRQGQWACGEGVRWIKGAVADKHRLATLLDCHRLQGGGVRGCARGGGGA